MARSTGNKFIDAFLAGRDVAQENRAQRIGQERFDLQMQDARKQDILSALLSDPTRAALLFGDEEIREVVPGGAEPLQALQQQRQQQELDREDLELILQEGDEVIAKLPSNPKPFDLIQARSKVAVDKAAEEKRLEVKEGAQKFVDVVEKRRGKLLESKREKAAAKAAHKRDLIEIRLRAELKSARTPEEKVAIDAELETEKARAESLSALAEKRRADIGGEDDLTAVFKEEILPLIEDFRSLLAAGKKRGTVTSELVDFTESDAITLAGQIFDAMIAAGFDTNDAKRIKDELDGDIQSRFKPPKDGKGSKLSALQAAVAGTTQATASTPKINVPGETKKKKKASSKTLSKEEFNKQMGF